MGVGVLSVYLMHCIYPDLMGTVYSCDYGLYNQFIVVWKMFCDVTTLLEYIFFDIAPNKELNLW